MNKKQGCCKVAGFTLVEMIVVMAIVGVLAGILVPSMLGYIKKAKFASMNASAKSLLNAGMIACRQYDVIKPINTGIYAKTGCKSIVNADFEDDVINKYIYEYFNDDDVNVWAIRIEDDVVTAACIASTADSTYIGTYPHPNTKTTSFKENNGAAPLLTYGKQGSWT